MFSMKALNKLVTSLSSFLHSHFLWLLLGCYAAAVLAPGLGLWIRDVSFGEISLAQLKTRITLPMLMLSLLATGDHAEHLRGLAAHGTGIFLVVCVVVPSTLGILLSWAVGEARLAPAKPHLKLLNWVNLLLLIYVNASVSLPEAIAYPDL